jgi:SdpC family antimicrobial peptide
MINTNITHKLCALLLSLAVPACGVEGSGPDSMDQLELEERSMVAYSGEQLFLGIFFGQGEVAEHLPTLWGDCGRETRNRVIAEMSPDVLLAEIDRLQADPANEVLSHQLDAAREVLAAGAVPHSDEQMYEVILELVRAQDPEYFERFAEVVASGDRNEIREAIQHGREIIRDIILVNENPFDPGEGQGIVEVLVVFVAVAVVAYVWLAIEVVGAELDQSEIFEEIMVEEIASQLAVY